MSGEIIGIDLGTTNSCCAVVNDDDEVTLIPYKGGETTIPSIFALDAKGNELVGHEAKRQWLLNPTRTVYGAKRLIGREYQSGFVEKMGQYFAYEMKPGEHNNVVIKLNDRMFNLSQVSSRILNKIRTVASNHLQKPVSRAVVTVPAYFNDRQRQAIKEAGALIDLKIERVINEPTAAAMAYGIRQDLNQTIAIYDLGGGTFDVSVIDIRNRTFEVRSTGGDVFLGGIDWDNALISHIIENFENEHGIDLSVDPVAMQRIKELAERTKIDLTSRTEVPFSIPFVTMTSDGAPLDINEIISREKLDTLTQHLVDRTISITKTVVEEAGIQVTQLDEVLLVGGQTRWPPVVEAVTNYFGRPPSKSVHPDEAVAIGAALYAHSLETDSLGQKVQLLDVISMQIGIENADGKMHQIFAKNACIPNQKLIEFTTSFENQNELVMRIYQGESIDAAANTLLGEFTLSGLRDGLAGSVKVNVVFTCDIDGILSLEATDEETGQQMKQSVQVSSTEL